MTDHVIEGILQRARELNPEARPQIISDAGTQFIARDFKEFIRTVGMVYVRTLRCYAQSNGSTERWQKLLKGQGIRSGVPLSLGVAKCLVPLFVEHDNAVRLHSAIGFVTSRDHLEGRDASLIVERVRKLETGREMHHQRRNGLDTESAITFN